MINFGDVPIGAVLPIPFATYAGSTGASITLTGLATTDIEVYKGTSITQRASDAGYALIDTDGIDIDGITGIHGFSIDTGDNTDAGFYTSGSYYYVVVSAVTVDSQTVNFIAATFRCVTAEGIAGQPKVDVAAWLGTAAATPTVAGVPEVDTTHWNGTAVTTPPAVNTTQISGDSVAADNAEAFFDGTGYAGTNNVIPTVTTVNGLAANTITAAAIATGAIDADAIADNAIDAGAIATGALTATKFAAGAIDAAALAADAGTEIATAVWAASLTELTADPGASPAASGAVLLPYMAIRNKRDTTATTDEIHNSAGTVLLTATLSDDATTFTKTKYV